MPHELLSLVIVLRESEWVAVLGENDVPDHRSSCPFAAGRLVASAVGFDASTRALDQLKEIVVRTERDGLHVRILDRHECGHGPAFTCYDHRTAFDLGRVFG